MTKDFEFVKELVDLTDWEELREQKAHLKSILESPVKNHLTEKQCGAIRGSICDIDHLQSLVIELEYLSPEEVLGEDPDAQEP